MDSSSSAGTSLSMIVLSTRASSGFIDRRARQFLSRRISVTGLGRRALKQRQQGLSAHRSLRVSQISFMSGRLALDRMDPWKQRTCTLPGSVDRHGQLQPTRAENLEPPPAPAGNQSQLFRLRTAVPTPIMSRPRLSMANAPGSGTPMGSDAIAPACMPCPATDS